MTAARHRRPVRCRIPSLPRVLLLLPPLLLCGCRRPAAAGGAPSPPLSPPVAVPADLGSNAWRRVARLLALGPRDAGTPGAARAAAWIAAELRAAGLEPLTDTFTDETPDGPRIFRNVLAACPGKGKGEAVLLSHFDTKAGISPSFAGANDGGSSTGLLLELAAWRRRSPPGGMSVLFAFLDGEECLRAYGANDGLHGSRRLAARLRAAGRRPEAVILLDMIGDRHLTFTLPRNGTASLKLLFLDAAEAQGCRHLVKLLGHDILDDHQPFLDAGFPAVALIDLEYGSAPGRNDWWHTPEDTLDKLSAASLQQAGAVTLEMLHRLEAAYRSSRSQE